MVSHTDLPVFGRFVFWGFGNQIVSFYECGFGSFGKKGGLRSGRVLPVSKRVGNGSSLSEVLHNFLLQRCEKFYLSTPSNAFGHLIVSVFSKFMNPL